MTDLETLWKGFLSFSGEVLDCPSWVWQEVSGWPSDPCHCLPDPEVFSSVVKGQDGFGEVLLEGLKGAPGAQTCWGHWPCLAERPHSGQQSALREGAASWWGPGHVTHSRLLYEFITNIWGGEGKEKLYCAASPGKCDREPLEAQLPGFWRWQDIPSQDQSSGGCRAAPAPGIEQQLPGCRDHLDRTRG